MSYADNWLKWFHVIERGASDLSARLLEQARADEAIRLLDVGTGIGEPAISAAARMRSFGRVTALDRDPRMIELARARALARGLDNIDFVVGDIDTIGLDAASMDSIVARWSLMFVADLPAALADLGRILRPGGYLAVACWTGAEQAPALSLARRAVYEHFGWPGPPLNSAFNLADNRALRQSLLQAGFVEVYGEQVPVVYEYDSVSDYIQNRLDLTGPFWDGMESASPAEREAVIEAIAAAAEPHRTASGIYRFENLAYCMCARVPAIGVESRA